MKKASKIKLIVLGWDFSLRQFVCMRTFEYNGIIYHPGYIIPKSVVDYMKSDEAEQKQEEVIPT